MLADNANTPRHRLSWHDFDDLARGAGGARCVRALQRTERSRRLLLLRTFVDVVTKQPGSSGPLPAPDSAWELLELVEARAPEVLDFVLTHPYTGSWLGYTTRLLHHHTSGVCPLWVHIGHINALAAAAAIRAGLRFSIPIPLWQGGAILPTLGLARLPTAESSPVVTISSDGNRTEITTDRARVPLPADHTSDAPGWWGLRPVTARQANLVLRIHLDDLDPYRGLYEPVPPQRLSEGEVRQWRTLLDKAWRLIVEFLPDMAQALHAGLRSLVPRPSVPFRMPSASAADAFGGVLISKPTDEFDLATMLIHEFQHTRLSGVLNHVQLHQDDLRERHYVPWRDDPRPIHGVFHGIYAFFGVTMFWHAVATGDTPGRRALFEFACWRRRTWRAWQRLRYEPALTTDGCRFLDGMATPLRGWQDQPVPADLEKLAVAIQHDHYAGWRLRHVRPDRETVGMVASAWLRRARLAELHVTDDRASTPVPDGPWSSARTDLLRLSVDRPATPSAMRALAPDATSADFAYLQGRFADSISGYREELAVDPERPASWTGLGLALAALGACPASSALLRCPELVRAVYREVRPSTTRTTTPDELADWIGRFLP